MRRGHKERKRGRRGVAGETFDNANLMQCLSKNTLAWRI